MKCFTSKMHSYYCTKLALLLFLHIICISFRLSNNLISITEYYSFAEDSTCFFRVWKDTEYLVKILKTLKQIVENINNYNKTYVNRTNLQRRSEKDCFIKMISKVKVIFRSRKFVITKMKFTRNSSFFFYLSFSIILKQKATI